MGGVRGRGVSLWSGGGGGGGSIKEKKSNFNRPVFAEDGLELLDDILGAIGAGVIDHYDLIVYGAAEVGVGGV